MTEPWKPTASLETLRARADLVARIRAFFAARGVMEVDTPVLSAAATVDVHIESERTASGRWLRTSPEFPMKRLLAAGSGAIYELGHVFRAGDAGRYHNPEFLMLEWYRPEWDHHRLMEELGELLGAQGVPMAGARKLTYREAWLEHAGLDPFSTPTATLARTLRIHHGEAGPEHDGLDHDGWLDFGMGFVVGPKLGRDAPCFIHDFPASQAALARVRPGDPPVAERFELFWHGIELANGFHELSDATEQSLRFAADRERRRVAGLVVPPSDQNLVAALQAGLPECAGVALGVDRLLMLLLNLPDLAATLPFPADRA
jgi:elongation factor P--(R)-beta-lysine ligase